MNSANSFAVLIAFIDLLWLFALIGIPSWMTATLGRVFKPANVHLLPPFRPLRIST